MLTTGRISEESLIFLNTHTLCVRTGRVALLSWLMKRDVMYSGGVGSVMGGRRRNSIRRTIKQVLVPIDEVVKVVQEDRATSKNVHSTMKGLKIEEQRRCSIFIE